MAESIVRLKVDASGATRALQGIQRQTNQLQNAFGGLRTAIAGIGIGFFFFDNITYRRAIEEREIKYHFISRCSKGTPLAQRAIKLTLLTAHYFIAR